jgi:tetratricopeptide (TPR) repeat protein
MAREPARLRRAVLTIFAFFSSTGLGAGCDTAPEIGPPPTADLTQADPEVAALILARVRDVEASPSDGMARGRLAQAYDANGFTAAAVEAYEQTTSLAPDNPRWLYHGACVRSELGDIEGALAAMDESIRRSARYGPAHWRRGQWLLDLGRLDEAEAAFRSALAVSPSSVAPRVGVARVHLKRKEPGPAIAELEELVREHPDEAYFRHLLVSAPVRAREAAPAADPVEPSWPDAWREELGPYRVGFAAELQRAVVLASGGKLDEAIPLFERLRTKRPDDVTLLANLGVAYSDAGRYEDAISVLGVALEKHPEDFEVHLNLAAVYHRHGRRARARRHADQAVQLNPDLPDARILRGLIRVTLGQRDEAIADFEAAQRLDSASPVAFTYAATVKSELKRWDAAIEDFEAAIARRADYAPAFFGLAYAQAKAGDLDGAQNTLQRAAEMVPDAPQVASVGALIQELRNRE